MLGCVQREFLSEINAATVRVLAVTRDGQTVRDVLAGSDFVLVSDLTLIECDRVLIRAVAGGTVASAARSLGLERSHLYKKLRKHRLPY